MTEYYPRDIADAVRTALENMPVAVVTGMRQTGKMQSTTTDSVGGLDRELSLEKGSGHYRSISFSHNMNVKLLNKKQSANLNAPEAHKPLLSRRKVGMSCI